MERKIKSLTQKFTKKVTVIIGYLLALLPLWLLLGIVCLTAGLKGVLLTLVVITGVILIIALMHVGYYLIDKAK